MPFSEALVMPFTVAIVIWTHDPCRCFSWCYYKYSSFGWKISHIKTTTLERNGVKVYKVSGQLFFGSVTKIVELFNYNKDPDNIVIDFSNLYVLFRCNCYFKIVYKYQNLNKNVTIIGLNKESKLFA